MTEPITPERLAEIREREQAATPGPWRTHDGFVPAGGYVATVLSGEGNATEPRAWLPTFSNDTGSPMARNVEADAEFMAHAREDVPALLAHIVELEADRTEARWTACYYRNAWWGQQEGAEMRLGLLPNWLTHDGADNAPEIDVDDAA